MDASKPVGSESSQQGGLPQIASKALSEEDVRVNAAILSKFPSVETDPNALMRVSTSHKGQLRQPETKGGSWLKQTAAMTFKGQDVGAVQKMVHNTFFAALAPCEDQLKDWEQAKAHDERFREEPDFKGESLPKRMNAKNLDQMAGQLKEAQQMIEGMKNLLGNLKRRYPDSAKKPEEGQAIRDLEETIAAATKQLERDSARFETLRSGAIAEHEPVTFHEEERPFTFHMEEASQADLAPISSRMTEKDIKLNSHIITTFPSYEEDPRAVLRISTKTGHLKKAEGGSWAKQYVSKQPLGDIQTTIQKTFSAAIAPCENQLRAWEKTRVAGEAAGDQGKALANQMSAQEIRHVEEQLQEGRDLVAGMNRIHDNLSQQYPNKKYGAATAEGQALAELKNTIEMASSKIETNALLLDRLRRAVPKEAREAVATAEKVTAMHAQVKEFTDAISAPENEVAPARVAHTTEATIEATRDLRSYLALWGPDGISLNQARELAKEGEVLVANIVEGSIPDLAALEANGVTHEKALSVMTWYFMSLAIEKGQGHESGSFAIEDPNGHLFHFLDSMPGTDRLSSHYPKKREPLPVRGARTQSNDPNLIKDPGTWGARTQPDTGHQRGTNVKSDPMPSGQTHLLFGQLKNPIAGESPLLFLKVEDSDPNSTSKREALEHAGGYVGSLGRKAAAKVTGAAANEQAGMYKEHVPGDIKKAFALILASAPDTSKQMIHARMDREGFAVLSSSNQQLTGQARSDAILAADAESLFSMFGIAYLNRFMEHAGQLKLLPQLDPKGVTDLNQAMAKLQSGHGTSIDHFDKRNGREVYLTHQEVLREGLSEY